MSMARTNRITAIATRTLYEIAPGAPVRWIPRVNGQIRVHAGRVWLTREGDVRDYWLEAGAAMPVAAGDVLWAGVEGEVPGRLEMRSQPVPLSIWHRVSHVLRTAAGSTRADGVGGEAWRRGVDGAAADSAACDRVRRARA